MNIKKMAIILLAIFVVGIFSANILAAEKKGFTCRYGSTWRTLGLY